MRWLALIALVAACRKEPRSAPPQPVENRSDAAVTRPAPPDANDACYSDCLKSNQMRAVSMEQIEADCRAQCASAKTP